MEKDLDEASKVFDFDNEDKDLYRLLINKKIETITFSQGHDELWVSLSDDKLYIKFVDFLNERKNEYEYDFYDFKSSTGITFIIGKRTSAMNFDDDRVERKQQLIDKFKYILKEQIDFIEELKQEDKEILKKYTFEYDRYVNSLKTGYYPFQMKRTDLKFQVAKNVSKLIDNIFAKIPLTKKEIIVYRGATNIYQGPYVSTSLDKEVSYRYIEDLNPVCCLYRIIIPKKSAIIPMFSISKFMFEEEVLLDRKRILKETKRPCKTKIENKFVDCIELIYS